MKPADDAWKRQLYSDDFLRLIAEEPHYLGWFIGRDKLGPLHGKWIRYCWDSDEPRALQAFRGSYKTTSVLVVGAVRWMLFHPDDRIGIIRKNYSAARDVTSTIASVMGLPEVKELFRYAHGVVPRITRQRDGQYEWNFKESKTPEGNLKPLGTESPLTGAHFDKVLCDDIITIKDKLSRAERERTKEMVHEIAANIIDPGKGSIWIGTPWHREDAWGEIGSFCEVRKYPISKYNFLGKKETEMKKKLTTPFLYAINYELEIGKDESLLFAEPTFSKGWDFSITGAIAQLDAAYDGTHYCALTIAAPKKSPAPDSQAYQAIGFCYAGNVKNWIPEVVKICKKYRVKTIYTETNPDKGYTADKLGEQGMRVRTYSENMNKHMKISAYLFDVWPRIEWDPATDDEYMAQVTDYKEGAQPDDAPDSAASLFREAFPRKKANIRNMFMWD